MNRTLYLAPGEAPTIVPDIPSFDGLRAVSIAIVMVSHSGLQNVVPGVFGVTIFFFISGFLITSLLAVEHEREGRINIPRFYVRRFLRLYPPLLTYLVACVAAALGTAGAVDPLGLGGALFYFANYVYALAPDHLTQFGFHLWSLSVEEHFYFLFPAIVVLAWVVGRPVQILAVICVLPVVARLLLVVTDSANPTYLSVATECRFDSILLGCITALLARNPRNARIIEMLTRPAVVGSGVLAIFFTFVYRDPFFREAFRWTIQSVALIPIVLAAIYTSRYLSIKRVLNSEVFRWVGVRSYSLYLWHIGAFATAAWLLPERSHALSYGLGWLISFIVAVGSYEFVEKPLFALRKRFGSHAHEASSGRLGYEAAVGQPDRLETKQARPH